MIQPVRAGRKLVQITRIHMRIVPAATGVAARTADATPFGHHRAHEQRQPLVEHDILIDGLQKATRLMEQLLVVERLRRRAQLIGDVIVKPDEHRVPHAERRIGHGARVASIVAVVAGAVGLLGGHAVGDEQLAAAERTN